MVAKFVVILACVAIAHGSIVKRDAPASTPLQDLEKHVEEFHKTVSEQFNQLASSKNSQELQTALKSGSDSVLQQLSAFSASLQGVLADANGKAKEAVEQARKNIERTAEELRKAHPEVEQKAAELSDKLKTAVQNVVQSTQQLAKDVAANVEQTNQKLAPKVKEAFADFAKQTEEVAKKLHEVANKQ